MEQTDQQTIKQLNNISVGPFMNLMANVKCQCDMHSADSSNELSDLHTTQTPAGDERWGAHFSGHWVATRMFA